MRSRLRLMALALGGLAHLSCGGSGSTPAAPSASITEAKDGNGAVGASSVIIPAHLQPLFARAPNSYKQRFYSLPIERQQAMIARFEGLPAETQDRLLVVAAKYLNENGGNVPPIGQINVTPLPATAPADWPVDGVIAGGVPMTLTFGMCNFTDPDLGDELKYKYDFYGTGDFDRGRCSESVTYPNRTPECFVATACVSDRQPGHDVCKSYLVCPGLNPPLFFPAPPCAQVAGGSFTGYVGAGAQPSHESWSFGLQERFEVQLGLSTSVSNGYATSYASCAGGGGASVYAYGDGSTRRNETGYAPYDTYCNGAVSTYNQGSGETVSTNWKVKTCYVGR